MEGLATMRSATRIPVYGSFLLYPGKSASGRIAGHTVRLTAIGGSDNPDVRLEVDGVVVNGSPDAAPTNAIAKPSKALGVFRGPMGAWEIDGPACDHRSDDCGAMIQFGGRTAAEPAESIDVSVKIAPYNQYSTDPGWP